MFLLVLNSVPRPATGLEALLAMLLPLWFISLGLAIIPAKIAKSKGRKFWSWYVYGVFLFLIALIHAATLTDPNQKNIVYVQSYERNNIANDTTSRTAYTTSISVEDQLLKVKKLYDDKLITLDEYENKRKEIIGRI